MSGELRSAAEEEDRRLLMPASEGCFRFMLDVERLSTRRERRHTDRGGGIYTGAWPMGEDSWTDTEGGEGCGTFLYLTFNIHLD